MTPDSDFFAELNRIEYHDRVSEVELKNFGDTDETKIFRCRGLNSEDLAKVDESVTKNAMMSELMDQLVRATAEVGDTSNIKTRIDAVKKITGIGDKKTPSNLVRKYAVVELGLTEPKPQGRSDVVKFAAVYPVEFHRIFNEINRLTGLGAEAKKKP